MSKKLIEQKAYDILNKLNINSLPIPIKEIANKLNVQLIPHDSKGNFSGLLLIQDDIVIIGYNPFESEVRQRFTFAHELGHYILHKERNDIFIDKKFKVLFRDERATTGEYKIEQEANAFAAALLMPELQVKEKIKTLNFDLGDESCLIELARIFNVSVQAMTFRIINLRLLYP